MICVTCGGSGCDCCEETGRIEIKCCPLEYVTNDIWEVIQLAELYEKGLPPVAGGALDQTKYFLDSARIVFAEQAFWKKKLGIIG